eukprot:1276100-Alexandrium_andersonii.AAC.1
MHARTHARTLLASTERTSSAAVHKLCPTGFSARRRGRRRRASANAAHPVGAADVQMQLTPQGLRPEGHFSADADWSAPA